MTETVDRTCSMESCKEKGTYTLKATCSNCGHEFYVKYTKGHEHDGSRAPCPACECDRGMIDWNKPESDTVLKEHGYDPDEIRRLSKG